MILVVAPQPAQWLNTLLDWADVRAPRFRPVAPWQDLESRLGPLRVVAPWQTPMWWAVRGVRRAMVRGAADRRIRADFFLRRAVGRLAVQAMTDAVSCIVAPAQAAETLFLAARSGVRRVLMADLPDLHTLHDDLDAAARHHPQSRLLRRHRAPRTALIRSGREQGLADVVVAHGTYGRGPHEVVLPSPVPTCSTYRPGTDVVLAGLCTARSGSWELDQLAERHPEWQFRVRMGDGLEPATLMERPNLAVRHSPWFTDAGVLIAPHWCESHAGELGEAAALGIPVVATRQAMSAWRGGEPVSPGDVAALERAISAALAGHGHRLRPGRDTLGWQAALGAVGA